VGAPAELLASLFAVWPQEKKKRIRTWLKFQAVTVNGKNDNRAGEILDCDGLTPLWLSARAMW
jgi:hypothetical protein